MFRTGLGGCGRLMRLDRARAVLGRQPGRPLAARETEQVHMMQQASMTARMCRMGSTAQQDDEECDRTSGRRRWRSRRAIGSLAVSFAVAGVSLAATAACASANLIVDGGFETPVTTVGGFTLYDTGTSFSAWNVVGASGNVAIINGQFTQNGFTFPAAEGAQWLDLTGLSSNSATGVAQTIATTPGTMYALSFDVGNIYDPSGVFGKTSTVSAQINGTQVLSATNSEGMGSTTQMWKPFSTAFTATSSSTTVGFINEDPSTDNSNGLDAVSAHEIISAPDWFGWMV